ncbi:MFS-type transporter SLC18B1 isoform X2 [Parasteatoda tepidariorum]|uniref:MFS-type transporter SLC18B1 isoform X2 n=1 Tax=Parasteatoda tepidariorum TaxID=114398 RepID=UPI001C727863|nr:MFS-type transporter SLC18B1 isoform X2 [Parasteatoda tepidariorum]XP_042900600.1 MFS-type transporter SLC18B1 isoform X2 [Parasteatoda tepidariorum]XP_042900604.1 MFS-type transporter SLC18B1 isoform X2 [Parasteatoda tepidariorum]
MVLFLILKVIKRENITQLKKYLFLLWLLESSVLDLLLHCKLHSFQQRVLDFVKKSGEFIALAFVVRTCEGVAASCIRIAAGTIVASQFQENVGATYAILEMCLGVANILGPVLGGALYELGGFQLPFFCIGTVILIDAVVIMFLLPEAERKEKQPTKFRNIFKVWMKPKILIFAFSIFSTSSFIGYMVVGLEPHTRQTDLSKFYIGLLFSSCGLIYAISSPFWGWLHDRMCRSTVINLVGSIFFITAVLLVGPVPFIPLEPSICLIGLAMTSMGFAAGSKTVSCFTGALYSAKNYGFPDDLGTYGIITSIITSSKALGSAFGPSIGGVILDTWGFRYGTVLYLVIELTMVAFLSVIIMTEKGGSKLFRTPEKDKYKSFDIAISLDSKSVVKNDQKN